MDRKGVALDIHAAAKFSSLGVMVPAGKSVEKFPEHGNKKHPPVLRSLVPAVSPTIKASFQQEQGKVPGSAEVGEQTKPDASVWGR